MADGIEVKLPESIGNWIFDLHDATRRALRSEDVKSLYEVEYKELTDKYFSQSAWPMSKVVAPECNHDEQFLIFYNELRTRHIFTSLKTQLADLTLADFTESWNNYIAIFEFILGSPNPDIALTTQWVHDIIVEFVYQFQGFCQYRCQIRSRSADEIKILDSNRDVWVLPTVMSILTRLSSMTSPISKKLSTMEHFAYFAAVEKIRLECLLGDYGSALDTCALIKLGDRSEPYYGLPSCHVNLYYHVGVCQMMLRKYDEAIDTFVEICLHASRVTRLGSGASKNGSETLMKKMLDKMLALTAICVALSPGVRVDDQVRELMESKYSDRVRRIQMGNTTACSDLFESSCPKFISSAIPDYKVQSNLCTEVFQNQVSHFVREVQQRVGALKLRSYLRLYASIDVDKLARFSDMTAEALTSQVLSYKLKIIQEQQSADGTARSSGVDYFVKDGSLAIDSTPTQIDRSNAAERFFFTGMRKNADFLRDVEKSYDNILS